MLRSFFFLQGGYAGDYHLPTLFWFR